MTKKLLLIILTTSVFAGCYISNEMENNFVKAFEAILPDTCEIYVIGQIYNYKNTSGNLPNNDEISLFLDSLDLGCRQKLDSVGVVPYNADSIDLTMRKNLKGVADTADFFITKSYRIKFEHDSMNIEYLNEFRPSSSKYQNKKFRLTEGE